MDELKKIYKAFLVRDADYRMAATLDLEDAKLTGIDESIYPKAARVPSTPQALNAVWAGFIAYFVLAVEAKGILDGYTTGIMPPPVDGLRAKSLTAYDDVTATYVTYFHESGSKYADPSGDKNFVAAVSEVGAMLKSAYFGHKLTRSYVSKILGAVRKWLVQNKLAGSKFHVYLADWKKGNWSGILDGIPEEHDIYQYFKLFVDKNPMPVEGVKLQQTLGGTQGEQAKKALLDDLGKGQGVAPDDVDPVKVSGTLAGEAALTSGYPMGVMSKLVVFGKEVVHLGAWDVPKLGMPYKETWHLLRDDATGAMTGWLDKALADQFKSKHGKVIQAHVDLPGSVYKGVESPAETPPTPSPVPTDDAEIPSPDAEDFYQQMLSISSVLGWAVKKYMPNITPVPLKETDVYDEVQKRWGFRLTPEVVFRDTYAADFQLVGAFADSEGTVHVLRYYDILEAAEAPVDVDLMKDVWSWTLKYTKSKSDQTPALQSDTAKIIAFLSDPDNFGEHAGALKPIPVSETDASAAAKSKFGQGLTVGSVLVHKKQGWEFTLLAAFQNPDDSMKIIVHRDDDGELDWDPDTGPASFHDVIMSGKLVLKSATVADPLSAKPGVNAPIDSEAKKAAVEAFKNTPGLSEWMASTISFGHMSAEDAVPIEETQVYKAAAQKGAKWKPGRVWYTEHGTKIEPLAAIKDPESGTIFPIYKINGTQISVVQTDSALAHSISIHTLMPDHKYFESAAPKYSAGQILQSGDAVKYQVAAYVSNTYLLQRLSYPATWLVPAALSRSKDWVETKLQLSDTQEVSDALGTVTTFDPVSLPTSWGVSYHTPVDTPLGVASLYAAMQGKLSGDIIPLFEYTAQKDMFGDTVSFKQYVFGSADFFSAPAAESSYAPPERRPEPDSDEADYDAEQGDPEMSGTVTAFTFLDKKGWTPAVKSESPLFEFDLGQKLKHPQGGTRTIIGYGFNSSGDPIYVFFTEKTNVNFKTASTGNKQYGPVLETIQKVVDHLKPKPGTPAPKFPKVNYRLGKTAKKAALDHDLVYVSSPENPPFFVGSELKHKETGAKVRLIGWVTKGFGPKMVLYVADADGGYGLATEPSEYVADVYELSYKHDNYMDEDVGEITFGKTADNVDIQLSLLGGVTIPSPLPDAWDDPVEVNQPAFGELPSGRHVSAGIVPVIWGGTAIPSGLKNAFALPYPTLLMRYPYNEFGGYKLSFPKGTVDSGESITKAAVREAFEETGLTMKPIAYLGDFKSSKSITRFFIGVVTGGNPKKADKETDAVTLKPFSLTDGPVGNWYDKLTKRDKKVVDATIAWLQENGAPDAVPVDIANGPAQVTGPQDVSAQVGTPTALPSDFEVQVVSTMDKQKESVVDYHVKGSVISTCNTKLATVEGETWRLVKQADPVSAGYPPVGATVSLSNSNVLPAAAGGAMFEVLGYAEDVSPPDISNVVSNVIVLGTKSDTFPVALNSVGLVGGQPLETYLQPVDFQVHEVTGVDEKPHLGDFIPSDDAKTEVWDALYKKAPFPVTSVMIAELKKHLSNLGAGDPDGFHATRNLEGGPSYGEAFTGSSSDEGYIALGYVTPKLSGGAVSTHSILLPQYKASPPFLLAAPVSDPTSIVSFLAQPAALSNLTSMKGAAPIHEGVWFTHPDPDVEQLMEALWTNGGNLSAIGVTMSTFKEKWLKKAKVPAYAVATKSMVQDIAALFVPGAATQAQRDAVVGCLKARMALTHKSKKPKAEVQVADSSPQSKAPASSPSSSYVAPPIAAPAKKVIPLGFNSMAHKQALLSLDESQFEATGEFVSGGSNPNQLLNGPGGKWFFKEGKNGETFRAYVDEAAYKLTEKIKPNTSVPVGVLEFKGKVGSVQPYVDNADPVPGDPASLSDSDMVEVLSQHAVDMFMGDHDGHAGNWLRVKGRVVAVDRGQAFKFLLNGNPESLDPTFKPPENVGDNYAKRLLRKWGSGDAQVPASAWSAMYKAIAAIQTLGDSELLDILGPVFEARNMPKAARTKVIKKIAKRRDSYLDDWTTVLVKLRPEFDWPSTAFNPSLVLSTTPEEMGFTPQEEKDIADAVASGARGKAIRIDKGAIEEQQVMVRRVKWSGVFWTMVQFRVSLPEGKKIATALMNNPYVKAIKGSGKSSTEELTGIDAAIANADLIKADAMAGVLYPVKESFWGLIRKAIGTMNHHFSSVKDTKYGLDRVEPALAAIPVLEGIQSETASLKGAYAKTKEPAEIVNAMATLYLNYLSIIKSLHAEPEKHVGQHTVDFYPFEWVPEVGSDEDRRRTERSPIEIVYKEKGANWPNATSNLVGGKGEVTVAGITGDLYGGGGTPQFVIREPSTQTQVYWIPPTGGIIAHHGIGFGMRPGDPTPQNVAQILKLFEEATRPKLPSGEFGAPVVSMKRSTDADDAVLFWARQVSALQGGGSWKPKSDGTGEVEPEFAAVMAQWRIDGESEKAAKALTEIAAKKLGVSVAQAKKMAASIMEAGYTNDAGFRRHQRIGYTRESLQKMFGDIYPVHRLNIEPSVMNFFEKAKATVSLISHNQRPFYGAMKQGYSEQSDFKRGGTQGQFGVFRKLGYGGNRVMYFDHSVLLRLDVYVLPGDEYGDVTWTRITDPALWAKATKTGDTTSDVSPGSGYQINYRHDVDLFAYLVRCKCQGALDRDQVIAFAKKNGWTEWGPDRLPPEKVFVV